MKIKLRDFLRDPKKYLASCESGAKYEIEEVGGQVRCCLCGIEGVGFAKRFQVEWGEVYQKIVSGSPITQATSKVAVSVEPVKNEPCYDSGNNDCMGCGKYSAKWVKWEDGEEMKLCEACIMKRWPSQKQRKMVGLQAIKLSKG